MKEFNHFTLEGRRVFDVRRNDKFTEAPVEHVPIQAANDDSQDRADSPGRSDAGSVANSIVSVTGPPEIISYPTPDSKGLLVNVANPNLFAWLPSNPKQDYNIHTLPNGSVVVTSESLGLLKYALLILLH